MAGLCHFRSGEITVSEGSSGRDCFVTNTQYSCEDLDMYCPTFTLHAGTQCSGAGNSWHFDLDGFLSEDDENVCKQKC